MPTFVGRVTTTGSVRRVRPANSSSSGNPLRTPNHMAKIIKLMSGLVVDFLFQFLQELLGLLIELPQFQGTQRLRV